MSERNIERVVITGPTGAVGTGVIGACIEKEIQVYALVHPGSRRLWQLPDHPLVHQVEASLGRLGEAKDQIPEACQVFYHLAWKGTFGKARNDMGLQVENIAHTLEAVALARDLGCHTFVGAGSQAEYGRVGGDLRPDTPAFPENGYGMAKLCAGQMSRELCAKLGIRHIWARILSVYGPCDGAKTMVMSSIRQLLAGESPAFTKGEQQWDYLYAKDAGRALYLLGEKGRAGSIYCLGSGQKRPLREYIELLRDAAAPGAKLGLGELAYGPNQVMELCADISSLTRDTGFVPEYSFEEGIRETCQWVLENQEKLI